MEHRHQGADGEGTHRCHRKASPAQDISVQVRRVGMSAVGDIHGGWKGWSAGLRVIRHILSVRCGSAAS